MSEKILKSECFIRDISVFTQSLPCQLFLANMKPQSIPDTMINNDNLHNDAVQILKETVSARSLDSLTHGQYGDHRYPVYSFKPWLERVTNNGQTILGPNPWWDGELIPEYSNLITEVVVNVPKLLDKYAVPGWTLYFDLLKNWEKPLTELVAAVISVFEE